MCSLQIFAFPFTGASFNPVRAFAPMLVGNAWSINISMYMFAPIIGAFVSAIVYILAFTNHPLRFGFNHDGKNHA